MELNKKLAEWRGWEYDIWKGWICPDTGENFDEAPNFPESLDACFKWLVPVWIDKIMIEQECSSDFAYAILFKKWLQELELNIPHAALAFCLAIEKLIDKEVLNV